MVPTLRNVGGEGESNEKLENIVYIVIVESYCFIKSLFSLAGVVHWLGLITYSESLPGCGLNPQ